MLESVQPLKCMGLLRSNYPLHQILESSDLYKNSVHELATALWTLSIISPSDIEVLHKLL